MPIEIELNKIVDLLKRITIYKIHKDTKDNQKEFGNNIFNKKINLKPNTI
jgi:hypothetical protein